MPTDRYTSKITRAERIGMILGGGALIAVLSSQVIFLAWISGFVG